MIKSFTRGSQVTMHTAKMAKQAISITLIATFILGILIFGLKSWHDYSPYERSSAWAYYWGDFKLNIPLVKDADRRRMTQHYVYQDGSKGIVSTLDIVNDPWHRQLVYKINNQLISNAILTCWSMLGFFLLACGGWVWRGSRIKVKKLLSGNTIVEPKVLKKLIKGELSPIKIRGISLKKNSETTHFLICGTTGGGKTTSLVEILPQIRKLEQKAVIIDTTGEFVAGYFREGKDILINPFDDRTAGWDPFIDCISSYHYDELAAAIIPQTSHDEFWTINAQIIFAEGLKHCVDIRRSDTQFLLDKLLRSSLKDLHEFLKPTQAATLVDPAGDKTAQSIRTHLVSSLRPLSYLVTNRESFSIRKWVQECDDDSWLFLTCTQDQLETLRPLLSALAGIALKSLLASNKNLDRRVWYIFDEFSSLQKFKALTDALKGIRKYGGCVVLGVQGLPQLESVYGYTQTKEILGLLNTRLIFNNNDPETARHLSNMLGEQELQEYVEGISYGAHDFRDGVSVNEQNKIKAIVSASDIMNLNSLEAFLKLPGNLPVTKVKYENTCFPKISPEFVAMHNYEPCPPKEPGDE